jgi:tRNA G37 N-methylase Trm5
MHLLAVQAKVWKITGLIAGLQLQETTKMDQVSFGRKAQRKVVTQSMKSVVDTSQEIRDEERRNFNIIAAPGYPELLSNLLT